MYNTGFLFLTKGATLFGPLSSGNVGSLYSEKHTYDKDYDELKSKFNDYHFL